jgi:hypothetical protein
MLIHRRTAAFVVASFGALATAACTNARLGDGDDEDRGATADAGGEVGDQPDAGGGQPQPDAAPPAEPDAAPPPLPDQVTLTHSSSLDIVGDNSVTCGPNDFTISPQSFYRVFDLAELGVDATFDVETVELGIQQSTSDDGSGQQATVVLHTLEGQLQVDNLREIVRQDIVVQELAPPPPGQVGGVRKEVDIEARIPPDSVLVVELTHGEMQDEDSLLIGSNRAAQSDPTFTRAPECGVGEPIDVDDITDEEGDPVRMHWVVQVIGQGGASLQPEGPASAAD